jgi:hypothetical protein
MQPFYGGSRRNETDRPAVVTNYATPMLDAGRFSNQVIYRAYGGATAEPLLLSGFAGTPIGLCWPSAIFPG